MRLLLQPAATEVVLRREGGDRGRDRSRRRRRLRALRRRARAVVAPLQVRVLRRRDLAPRRACAPTLAHHQRYQISEYSRQVRTCIPLEQRPGHFCGELAFAGSEPTRTLFVPGATNATRRGASFCSRAPSDPGLQHPQVVSLRSYQQVQPVAVCVYSSAHACSLHACVRGGIVLASHLRGAGARARAPGATKPCF